MDAWMSAAVNAVLVWLALPEVGLGALA